MSFAAFLAPRVPSAAASLAALFAALLPIAVQAQTPPSVTVDPVDIADRAPVSHRGFVNLEVPQVKPITVATVSDGILPHDLLLVCNTPDNSVEIYDANPPHRFIQRVPVGLGPVTVRWEPNQRRFFTCNFTGDSVSVVRLGPSVTSQFPVEAFLERTVHVGDEPSDITFLGNGRFAVITLNTKAAVTIRSSPDMGILVHSADLIWDNFQGLRLGVKQPRQIETLIDGRIFVLNFQGDAKVLPSQFYDLDLFIVDPTSGDAYPFRIAGEMGTTNHAFAVSSDRSKIFVVGTQAQNLTGVGVDEVRELKTGFVQSHMWVMDIIPGLPPKLQPEAESGPGPLPVLPAAQLPSINLNRDYTLDGLEEVDPALALSQPTDVLLLETNETASRIDKIFLTAYHSDKVAVLHPEPAAPGGYRINQIHIPVVPDLRGYGVAGPRALAYSRNAVDANGGGQPGLVFTANRLNNSVSVINPHTETVVDQFYLRHDPTPVAIRKGRKFLYSASQFSGNKMVTCASCHVDGRTDSLVWDLGGLELGPPIDPHYHDGNGQTIDTMPNFPNDKGPMATQTLQGLVNSRVNEEMQVLFTNAPYHWRGDKERFNDFNEAFVNLQGMENISSDEDPKGITDDDMKDYTRFINTIAHPPNPEQWIERTTLGSLGDDPNDPTKGEGALWGMKIYHVLPIVGPRSCVQCHTLPDGSSNTSTVSELIPGTLTGATQVQPFETAATRNMFQREMIQHRDTKLPSLPLVVTGNYGLLHEGNPGVLFTLSINDFVGNVFLPGMPGPSPDEQVLQVESMIAFMRQFDTGLAPMIGLSYTYTPGDPLNGFLRRLIESQVEQANVGMAVYTRIDGRERGYYYDLTATPPGYREEGTTNVVPGTFFENMSLAAANESVVILQATPLGNERRVASLTGIPAPIADTANRPSGIKLEAMAPPTQWVDVTKMTANLDPTPGAISLQSLRALTDAVIPEFGVPFLRHEPPRRFRVSGKNIRNGARLAIGMSSDFVTDPNSISIIWMELFPTGFKNSDGAPIWETSAEADAMITMALLNGGLWAPGVAEVLLGTIPPTDPLDPLANNWFLVGVLNEDNTLNSNIEWQRLSVQEGR